MCAITTTAATTRRIPNAEWKANKRQKNVDYIVPQFGLTLITYSIAHLVMLSAEQVIKLSFYFLFLFVAFVTQLSSL